MPSPTLSLDAWVLGRRPSGESFEMLTVFAASHGRLYVLRRLSRRGPGPAALDLFDEAALLLESPAGAGSWFLREARALRRHPEIARSYEALQRASAIAAFVVRNDVPDESRPAVHTLLASAFGALARGAPPGIVHLKTVYCLARDEGYPLRQQWLPALSTERRELAERLLRTPLETLVDEDPAGAAALVEDLLAYLSAHTDLRVG